MSGRSAERWRTYDSLPSPKHVVRFKLSIDDRDLAELEELAQKQAVSTAEMLRLLVRRATGDKWRTEGKG